jgi:hypothetical protein
MGKGMKFVCRSRGKGTRLFVDVQGKGRKMNLFLFPEHLQTILFPSLYIYKQSCSTTNKHVPFSLKNYDQGVQGFYFGAHIFLLKAQK